mmetsp:Transcript_92576/g.262061  ORF Transcript_92576/g.262061 Transcript_92576/m.262061 type:complete len:208 (-) Transcript_92576:343-966(-)
MAPSKSLSRRHLACHPKVERVGTEEAHKNEHQGPLRSGHPAHHAGVGQEAAHARHLGRTLGRVCVQGLSVERAILSADRQHQKRDRGIICDIPPQLQDRVQHCGCIHKWRPAGAREHQARQHAVLEHARDEGAHACHVDRGRHGDPGVEAEGALQTQPGGGDVPPHDAPAGPPHQNALAGVPARRVPRGVSRPHRLGGCARLPHRAG